MTQLTATGLQVSRLADRLVTLTADVRAIFGADLDLSPNTVDGQVLGIFAAAAADLDMLLEEVYNAFQPQNATGVTLSRLVQLNGITRIAGSYSTVPVTLGGQNGTLVPAGTLLRSTATLAVFSTDADVTIGASGVANVAATATEIGAQAAPAGTLTGIDTPVFGLQTSTNAAAATVGRERETDGQLRARRTKSTSYPGQTVRDAIEAGVANLEGVTHVRVYENDTDAVDTNGQAKNSIYTVVEGGDPDEIAQVLLAKKTAGVPTVGNTSGNAVDGTGRTRLMAFSRPVHDEVYITVTISRRAGFPADGEQQIKDLIEAYGNDSLNYTIGQEVIQSDFYAAIASVPGKSIAKLALGTAPNPTSTANLATAYDHLPVFSADRVTVVFQ